MNGVSRDTSYIPQVKSAFPAQLLQQMVSLLPEAPHRNIIKVPALLMFFAALRQSEVLPHSVAVYDASKNLSRNDFIIEDNVAYM